MTVIVGVMVPGTPVPQGSKRIVPTARGPRLVDTTGERLKAWRRSVADAIGWHRPPVEGPVFVHLQFWLPVPAKSRHAYPVRPDLDKLTRAVFDALTMSGVIGDDSQVVDVRAGKGWHPGGWTGLGLTVAHA